MNLETLTQGEAVALLGDAIDLLRRHIGGWEVREWLDRETDDFLSRCDAGGFEWAKRRAKEGVGNERTHCE